MGTPIEEPSTELNPTEPVQDDNVPGPNPNWEAVLNVLPPEFHKLVTPEFTKWDQAANARIESLNTQYAPYQPFIDHGIDPETLKQANNIYNMINERPEQVLAALQQQLGITNPDKSESGEVEPAEGAVNLPPDYEKIQGAVEKMAGMLLEQQQDKERAIAAKELETELETVKGKYGEFDVNHFLPYLSHAYGNGQNTMQAADSFFAMRDEMLKQQQAPFAPKLLGANSGGGTGLPSNAIDVRKLEPADRRKLVVQMLERMNTPQS